MFSFRMLIILAFSFMISSSAMAAYHFSEVYGEQGVWRVDHFEIESGKLQNLLETRTFTYEVLARQFAQKIKLLNRNKSRLHSLKLVSSEAATTPLWTVTQEWSEEWEEKYADWVSQNYNKSFFVKYNLATDCADAAYALRWIFSRNNNLPAAATLAGTGVIASQLSAKAEWNNLPTHNDWDKDERFLAGLNWLLDSVYTKTLYVDTYPVALKKETIKPGLINLLGGHTEIFNKVSYVANEIPLEVLSSTVPRAVRELAARPFLDSSVTSQEYGGLVNFRWPQKKSSNWDMVAKEGMPQYSLEQYQNQICEDQHHFTFCLFNKLGMTFKPELIIEKIIVAIEETVKQRTQIVKDGLIFCQRNDCSPGTAGWEDWSTPSRDKRLAQMIVNAQEVSHELEVNSVFDKWYYNTDLPEMNLSYKKFQERLFGGLVSVDPRDSLDARWALTFDAIRSTIYKTYNEGQELRNILITQAHTCRETPDLCKKSIKSFQELSSLEIDFKLRKILKTWHNFCKNEECPEDKKLDEFYENIWFQSPMPWDSIARRQGTMPLNPSVHVLDTRVVQTAGDNFLILADNQIYDITKRKVVKTFNHQVGFEQSLGVFYSINMNSMPFELVIYDKEFEPISRIGIDGEYNDIFSLDFYELGEGKLLLGFSESSSYTTRLTPIRIFDLNNHSIEVLGAFNGMVLHSSANEMHFLFHGENSIIMRKTVGVKLSVSTYPQLPKAADGYLSIDNFIHLGGKEYLISYSPNSDDLDYVIKYSPTSIEKLFEAEHGLSLERINAHFFFAASYDENGNDNQGIAFLFDAKMNFYFKNENMKFVKAGKNRGLVFHGNSAQEWQGALIGPEAISNLSVSIKKDAYLFTATENWFSTWEEKSFKIFDYQGRTLEENSFVGKGLCAHFTYLNCEDRKDALMVEFLPASIRTSELDYYQIGQADDLNLEMPLAYAIFKQSGDDMISPSIEGVKEHNQGLEIKVGSGTYLWYPEL